MDANICWNIMVKAGFRGNWMTAIRTNVRAKHTSIFGTMIPTVYLQKKYLKEIIVSEKWIMCCFNVLKLCFCIFWIFLKSCITLISWRKGILFYYEISNLFNDLGSEKSFWKQRPMLRHLDEYLRGKDSQPWFNHKWYISLCN